MARQSSPFDQFHARTLLTWPLLTLLVVVLATVYLIRVTGADDQIGNILGVMEFEAICAVWGLYQCRRYHINLQRLFGPSPNDPRIWGYVLLAVPLVVLSGGTVWLRVWLRHLLLSRSGPSSLAAWMVHRPQFGSTINVSAVASLIQGLTLVPIVEEFVFRGLLLHRWARKWGMTRGLLLSSFAFSLMHKDLLGTFVFGLVMALLYVRTQSLVVPIVCHALDVGLVFVSQTVPGMGAVNWNLSLCFPVALLVLLLFSYSHWPKSNSFLPYFSARQQTKDS
jgi:uncharacterized protein